MVLWFWKPVTPGEETSPPDWPVERGYRVRVEVQPAPELQGPYLPFAVAVPFGPLLREAGVTEEFDPQSIVVTHFDPATQQQPVAPHLASEDFQRTDTGRVSWVRPSPEPARYFVYFDTRDHGPYERGYIPPIGHGDNFRYNRPGGTDPLWAHGIAPCSADLDGDGRIDLVSRAIYSDTWGQIMLSCHEQTYAAVDWYGTGQLDLVAGGEGGLFYFFGRPTLDHLSPPPAAVSATLEVRPTGENL